MKQRLEINNDQPLPALLIIADGVEKIVNVSLILDIIDEKVKSKILTESVIREILQRFLKSEGWA